MPGDDRIKPVPPVHRPEARLHADPSLRVKPSDRQKKSAVPTADRSEGVSLEGIDAETAALLLLLPVMEEPKALGIRQFADFKSGLRKIAAPGKDAPTLNDVESGSLRCADQVIGLLRSHHVASTLVSQLEKQITACGKDKPVVRG